MMMNMALMTVILLVMMIMMVMNNMLQGGRGSVDLETEGLVRV